MFRPNGRKSASVSLADDRRRRIRFHLARLPSRLSSNLAARNFSPRYRLLSRTPCQSVACKRWAADQSGRASRSGEISLEPCSRARVHDQRGQLPDTGGSVNTRGGRCYFYNAQKDRGAAVINTPSPRRASRGRIGISDGPTRVHRAAPRSDAR